MENIENVEITTEEIAIQVDNPDGDEPVTDYTDRNPDDKLETTSDWIVDIKNSLRGYINKKGDVKIEHQFQMAYPFSEDLALVKKGDKFGFIDKTGNPVIHFQYANAHSFKDGFAKVQIDGIWCVIDKKGVVKK